ncbi:thioredoxin family protein [Candidatus Izemoplasma sp. B36]|uniref:thioredoxin family protein n=1 Tax=Candidatus Izemoplasma sp. B36 TaxID=3242468 RepID=UPI003558A8D7
MNIKVLGSGCKKCQKLEANVKEALVLLNKEANVDHVTDYNEIVSYNVMSTPALVVDGKVVSSGRLLTPRQLVELLK